MLSFLTCVVLTAWVLGTQTEGKRDLKQVDDSLGTGFDISKIKIGTDVLPKGSTLFKRIPSHCIRSQTPKKSDRTVSYFKNTASLVKSFQVSAGLTPSFLSFVSLKNSLSGTFSKLDREEKNVSGATMKIHTFSSSDYLEKKCLLELDDEFERDFKALKKDITSPHLAPSWDDYKYFLKKYGSHYVSHVNYGASVTQYMSAESSLKYSKHDFTAKACLALAGPVHVGVIKAKLCGGISKEDQNSAQSLQIDRKLVVLGGTDSTRNKVLNSLNSDYIQMLLNEGRDHKSPVSYKFNSIADMLMSRYRNTAFASQAANFKSYLEGFVNFDCTYKTDKYGLLELQKFEVDPKGPTSYPQYRCTIAHEGCRNDSDCHWKGVCKCHGDTCVRYDQTSGWYGNMKKTAMINNGTSPGVVNKYCKYSKWKVRCTCSRPPYTTIRQPVWKSSQSPGIAQKAKTLLNLFFKSFE